MTRRCDICGKYLPRSEGRGRPALRHPECQEQHRRDYLRDKKREERAR